MHPQSVLDGLEHGALRILYTPGALPVLVLVAIVLLVALRRR